MMVSFIKDSLWDPSSTSPSSVKSNHCRLFSNSCQSSFMLLLLQELEEEGGLEELEEEINRLVTNVETMFCLVDHVMNYAVECNNLLLVKEALQSPSNFIREHSQLMGENRTEEVMVTLQVVEVGEDRGEVMLMVSLQLLF
ncbi:hypothetical protein NE237_014159 [Protea cynaroides]|uniref:Uncharacterized protein n=1 Tax=Protea cynaroides TaxID=273540 RepID=A0A9Q0GKD8_9MAGN|nr:hypothetical protein NE237_014159 [Protea cynaroides]